MYRYRNYRAISSIIRVVHVGRVQLSPYTFVCLWYVLALAMPIFFFLLRKHIILFILRCYFAGLRGSLSSLLWVLRLLHRVRFVYCSSVRIWIGIKVERMYVVGILGAWVIFCITSAPCTTTKLGSLHSFQVNFTLYVLASMFGLHAVV